MTLSRRHLLQSLAALGLVAAAEPVVEPVRRYWFGHTFEPEQSWTLYGDFVLTTPIFDASAQRMRIIPRTADYFTNDYGMTTVPITELPDGRWQWVTPSDATGGPFRVTYLKVPVSGDPIIL